jgi:hypothetical protein
MGHGGDRPVRGCTGRLTRENAQIVAHRNRSQCARAHPRVLRPSPRAVEERGPCRASSSDGNATDAEEQVGHGVPLTSERAHAGKHRASTSWGPSRAHACRHKCYLVGPRPAPVWLPRSDTSPLVRRRARAVPRNPTAERRRSPRAREPTQVGAMVRRPSQRPRRVTWHAVTPARLPDSITTTGDHGQTESPLDRACVALWPPGGALDEIPKGTGGHRVWHVMKHGAPPGGVVVIGTETLRRNEVGFETIRGRFLTMLETAFRWLSDVTWRIRS